MSDLPWRVYLPRGFGRYARQQGAKRPSRGVAAERSAQRACERSNDWRRGAASSPDPYLRNSRPQYVGEVVPNRLVKLFVRARPRLAVGSPAIELRGVPEADALHVLVANLDHALRPQWRERQVLANGPAAPFGGARGAGAFFFFGPRPRMVVER